MTGASIPTAETADLRIQLGESREAYGNLAFCPPLTDEQYDLVEPCLPESCVSRIRYTHPEGSEPHTSFMFMDFPDMRHEVMQKTAVDIANLLTRSDFSVHIDTKVYKLGSTKNGSFFPTEKA